MLFYLLKQYITIWKLSYWKGRYKKKKIGRDRVLPFFIALYFVSVCNVLTYLIYFFHKGALLLLLIGKYHDIKITHIPDSEVPE